MANKQNLLLLFENPTEPVFLPKGKDQTVFQVPQCFLTKRYKGTQNLRPIEAGNIIEVEDIPKPDLRKFYGLKRTDQFCLFLPRHCEMAAQLIHLFMEPKTVNELQSLAVYVRDRLNAVLFNYALSVALLHRSDTKHLTLPTFVQTFPHRFVSSEVMCHLKEESFVMKPDSRRFVEIPRDFTANDLEPEHRLWYFREDMGINLHHWHWHLVYPGSRSLDTEIVKKDRRGELFYYMHQQIIARYNLERFSNNLARVQPFNNLRSPITEGYFPKIDVMVGSRSYPSRLDNTLLSDVNLMITQYRVRISDLELWTGRILDAIHQKFVISSDGEHITLDEITGIDILGDMIEATKLSPNFDFYGNLHNSGHNMIALAHDSLGKHLEPMGVMGDNSTAMRDPIFYRWHAHIDEIFQEHKKLLKPYTEDQLKFDELGSIQIASIKAQVESEVPNQLFTYWEESDLDLSVGLDFQQQGSLPGRFTHLQHQPFHYEIIVLNTSGQMKVGTVRIFLAPKYDERGYDMHIREQRLMMVELDKFEWAFKPGKNVINQLSTESSVTIPYERTFFNVRASNEDPSNLEHNMCNCGWPQHMLIPKGLHEGLQCILFVMITNLVEDRVKQEPADKCSNGSSYCGIRDRKYPDRRAMGYPFDRVPEEGVSNLAMFTEPFENMKIVEVLVKHEDKNMCFRQNDDNDDLIGESL